MGGRGGSSGLTGYAALPEQTIRDEIAKTDAQIRQYQRYAAMRSSSPAVQRKAKNARKRLEELGKKSDELEKALKRKRRSKGSNAPLF